MRSDVRGGLVLERMSIHREREYYKEGPKGFWGASIWFSWRRTLRLVDVVEGGFFSYFLQINHVHQGKTHHHLRLPITRHLLARKSSTGEISSRSVIATSEALVSSNLRPFGCRRGRGCAECGEARAQTSFIRYLPSVRLNSIDLWGCAFDTGKEKWYRVPCATIFHPCSPR